MATQDSTMNSSGIEVYSGNWGHYPCEYQTFLKIKKLHKYYNKSLSQSKTWFRWARKMEHNRKTNEPKTCPVFSEIVDSKRQLPSVNKPNAKLGYSTSLRTAHSYWVSTKKGEAYSYFIPGINYHEKNHSKSIVVRDFAIREAYQMARMPVQDPESVQRLPLSIKEIDTMLAEIENL